MKRLIPIMTILCIGLVGFVVYYRFYSDRTGPEIYVDDSIEFFYNEDMSNAELMEGVTAIDAKDGDVTDSLEIESVYESSDNEYVITYAAKDHSMNISKARRVVGYSSEKKKAKKKNDSESTDFESSSGEQSVQNEGQNQSGETTQEEVTEAVSAGSEDNEAARAEQEAAADAMDPAFPRIYLTDYVVQIPLGTTVDRLSYVRDITDDVDNAYDLWHNISIVGDLDTSAAGTYENTYFVTDSQNNTSNLATIRFIVQ